MLGGAAAGEHAEGRLELTEDRRLARRELHVGREHELAADTAHATLDLRDRDEAAVAQVVEQQRKRWLARQPRCLGPILGDPRHVDVGDEVVRVGALEHQDPDAVIGLGLLDQRDQIANQLGRQEIHRRRRDLHHHDCAVWTHGECLENHGTPLSMGSACA